LFPISSSFYLQILILVHFISFYTEIVPIQHSIPARKTSSQARAQDVLTPTPRAPLDGTPAVPQLRTQILDRLASHPLNIAFLKDLMDVSLELDTRYHERQKQKNHHQEKKPEASKSNSSHHQNSSSSSHKKKNFHSQRRDRPHSSLLN
ncbi:hypothetical protein O181_113642, partial [Austropuccinia psidii MF-1]|nr:hypothetical protein [Austropuccinia psidii MF-1]